ncbi:hypothetical protein psyc5s11_46840 [Clostridium gelidum]|uniref:Glycosyl transferase family 1 domain-containing protein n=1 Tax=Clostridium gelidum TaxID=704125 RepID=A0ABM7T9J1_9CLOT|nr:glycosyltransferase family 4 protein [Clostridium gelidum]BCZ48617.1 hypothetical protein psyc5s11_46840 [Clostridium gelidum]
MNKVLHITAHLGGGVGKVLSNVCSYNQNDEYEHAIILLEKPQQLQFVNQALENGVEVFIEPSREIIEKKIKEYDIVQIEWWNHPLMCKFLYNFPEMPVRLIIWSHISGCSYPFIKKDFIKNCNRFLFTSPYSLENIYLRNQDTEEFIKNNTDIIYSSGGFSNIKKREHFNDNVFNIGYIGTLNFCKLKPEFVTYCNEINISNSKFIMVGDNSTQNAILNEAEKKGIDERFEFIGYTDNVQNQLNRFDVFGYPLNTEHYGTTENALLEAMAAGVPPIVLNQCTEKYLVKNMETGIVVNNEKEYGNAIRYLYENVDERIRIGNNARTYVLEKFSLKNTIMNLNKSYECVMKTEKKDFSFKTILGSTPSEWFLSCLGDDKQIFKNGIQSLKCNNYEEILENQQQIQNCRQILKEKNKSSIYQFQRYFKDDKFLSYWKNVLERKEI